MARSREGRAAQDERDFPALAAARRSRRSARKPYGILVTGVGGTGVVTIGAILGMAAHLEGKGCGSIDMAGLAQKGGAVYSHVKIGAQARGHPCDPGRGRARPISCSAAISSSPARRKCSPRSARARRACVVNTAEIYPGDFTHDADFSISDRAHQAGDPQAAAGEAVTFVDATGIATALLGNSIAANMFMLGYAWQKGLVPLDDASLLRAIELNGEAVEMNRRGVSVGPPRGRRFGAVEAIAAPSRRACRDARLSRTLDEVIDSACAFLTAYQDDAYAARYSAPGRAGRRSRAEAGCRVATI